MAQKFSWIKNKKTKWNRFWLNGKQKNNRNTDENPQPVDTTENDAGRKT